jgi:hypothetical protein
MVGRTGFGRSTAVGREGNRMNFQNGNGARQSQAKRSGNTTNEQRVVSISTTRGDREGETEYCGTRTVTLVGVTLWYSLPRCLSVTRSSAAAVSQLVTMFSRFLRASACHARRMFSPRSLLVGVGVGCAAVTASRLTHADSAAPFGVMHAAAAAAPTTAPTNGDAADEDENAASTYPVNIDASRLLPDRPPNLAVRGVLFVTRHGSRTPMSLLPGQTREDFQQLWGNCPLGDHSTIPCGRGLLTTFGEFQLASVGWHMRQRYVHHDGFLPETFDPTLFRFRSTDLPRTQLSLARMVQGLYPGLPLDTLAPLIEVRKQKDETMYPNHYFCPRLKEMYIEAWSVKPSRARVCAQILAMV